MMKFARSTGYFYDVGINRDIPEDAIHVPDELAQACFDARCAGKIIVGDDNGMPVIADPPPPSAEEIASINAAAKTSLLAQATALIGPLQDAVDLGMATKQEISDLAKFRAWRVMINRVDTSIEKPEWPTNPLEKKE